MTFRTCAVTGANGFVGRAVCRRFQAQGWRVLGLVHRPGSAPQGCEERVFVLGDPPNSKLLSGVDVLVHAAYDFSMRSWADICRVNVVGSEYLFDAATRIGIKHLIFISSMAAFEGCRSKYGLGKLATEEAARIRGGTVIRPGFIYGAENGGLAGAIVRLAKVLPIVPMIGSGRYPLYACHIYDLCDLIVRLAEAKEPMRDIVTAASESPVTLRALVEQANAGASSPVIVPIPWRFVAGSLWLAEAVGLRLSFRSDNVVSIAHANRTPDFTPLQRLPVSFRPFLDATSDLSTKCR
jgi:nucleoside-diphosphate-sugar epimerase